MMADRPDFHIITGGPGSGKTTLIDALAALGFQHMPEAGRAIIRDQVAIGGVPDVSGFLRLCGLPVPTHVIQAADLFRYQRRVFIAPPWREIFVTDAERKQDFAEAHATYEAMVTVYADLGYELVSLPLAPVAERVRFVRARMWRIND